MGTACGVKGTLEPIVEYVEIFWALLVQDVMLQAIHPGKTATQVLGARRGQGITLSWPAVGL